MSDPATITTPGVVEEMPEHIYHADPTPGSISASMAKVLARPGGPARLRHQLDNPQPAKKAYDLGTAAHRLILGVGADIAIIPDEYLSSNGTTNTKAAKAFIDEARADGKTPLKKAEAKQVVDMASQLLAHPEVTRMLEADSVQHELSAFRIDEPTGLWLRCRYDSIAPTILADYKTVGGAEAATPRRFARTAWDLGYHQQAAWYLDTAAALGLADPDAPFMFITQEKDAPYLVAVHYLTEPLLDLGREANRRAIDLYAECLAKGDWPGYDLTPNPIEPPAWALADDQLDTDLEAGLEALIAGGLA